MERKRLPGQVGYVAWLDAEWRDGCIVYAYSPEGASVMAARLLGCGFEDERLTIKRKPELDGYDHPIEVPARVRRALGFMERDCGPPCGGCGLGAILDGGKMFGEVCVGCGVCSECGCECCPECKDCRFFTAPGVAVPCAYCDSTGDRKVYEAGERVRQLAKKSFDRMTDALDARKKPTPEVEGPHGCTHSWALEKIEHGLFKCCDCQALIPGRRRNAFYVDLSKIDLNNVEEVVRRLSNRFEAGNLVPEVRLVVLHPLDDYGRVWEIRPAKGLVASEGLHPRARLAFQARFPGKPLHGPVDGWGPSEEWGPAEPDRAKAVVSLLEAHGR